MAVRFSFVARALLALAPLAAAAPWRVELARAQTIGAEQTLNQATTGTRALTWDASMDIGASAGVAVWQHGSVGSGTASVDGSGTAVLARRIDRNGAPLGSEFVVNTYTTGDEAFPVVRMLTDGGFAVAWSRHLASNRWDVRARVFDSTGAPTTSEFQVASQTSGSQYGWDIVRHAQGAFTVVWGEYPNLPGGNRDGHVMGRRFSSGGTAVADEFSINQGGNKTISQPNASGGDNDGFVVVWSQGPYGTADVDVQARIFDAGGKAVGGQFAINASSNNAQTLPVVETDGARALAVWREGASGATQTLVGREVDRSGSVVGNAVTLSNVGPTGNAASTVSGLGDNRFAVAWPQGEGAAALNVKVRVIGASTAQLGAAFTVNSTTTADQGSPYGPTLRSTGTAGEFLVVWPDRSRGSGGDDIVASTVACDENVCPSVERPCGDPLMVASALTFEQAGAGDHSILASDALFVLRAALGSVECAHCVCDVDGSGHITATDALSVLIVAVGGDKTFECPACAG